VSPSQWIPRPLERAQQVYEHCNSLAAFETSRDLESITLALLRTACQDRATLEHALVLYRARTRDTPDDLINRKGAALMARVGRFLRIDVAAERHRHDPGRVVAVPAVPNPAAR
jgi:hypothetical protein